MLDRHIIPRIDIRNNNITLRGLDHMVELLDRKKDEVATLEFGDLVARAECIRGGVRYMITIAKLEPGGRRTSLHFRAIPLAGGDTPEGAIHALSEVCEVLDLWELSDVY